jgi:hypothetical protein
MARFNYYDVITMKFYQSPLSLSAILLFSTGLYLIVAMLRGAWPTYYAFIFLGVGIVMFLVDYNIRKSSIQFQTKLIIQTICTVGPLLILYLYFLDKI